MLDLIAVNVLMLHQGCLWHPFETDGSNLASRCDDETYHLLEERSKEIPDLLQRINVIDLAKDPIRAETMWYNDVVGGVSVSHSL